MAGQVRGRDDALGVEHVEQLAETAIERADQFMPLDAHVLEEDGARRDGVGADLVDRPVGQALARDIDQEKTDAVGLAADLLELARAGDD